MATLVCLRANPDLIRTPVRMPGSKSMAARALILAYIYKYLKGYEIRIEGLPDCDDTLELKSALHELSSKINSEEAGYYNVGTGGTSLRFFLALVASMRDFTGIIDCAPSLRQRPIAPLIKALRAAGADIEGEKPPLVVRGRVLDGNGVRVAGGCVSSQFVSAIIMASLIWQHPLGKEEDAGAPGCVSRPYIDMTLDMIREFESIVEKGGVCKEYSPRFQIESDWSAASYFFELALIHPGREISICGLTPQADSLQGDARCASVFEQFGVSYEWIEGEDERILKIIGVPERIESLRGGDIIHLNLKEVPDLVPALAVGACMSGVRFRFTGIGHLRHKESDRIESLSQELSKVGFKLQSTADTISWDGNSELRKVQKSPLFDAHGDHRIAMALAMTAARFGEVSLSGAESINKSFPGFIDMIKRCGIEEI